MELHQQKLIAEAMIEGGDQGRFADNDDLMF